MSGGMSSGSRGGASKSRTRALQDRCKKFGTKASARVGRGLQQLNFTDTRRERVRIFCDVAEEFFNGYKLRLPNSAVFADYQSTI
jgi:hypothetical protein